MVRVLSVVILVTAALAGGCVPESFLQPDPTSYTTASVQSPLFATPAPVVGRLTSAIKGGPSSPEASLAVDRVGRKIIAANPSLGMQPAFSVIGSPNPEIFHQETTALFVTEGLVRQCKTESQLAAILSIELARMAAEREVLISPQVRRPEKRPPIAFAMGNAGQFNGLEQLQQEEAALLGADSRRPSKRFVPPDPISLARAYMEAAGFDKKDLESMEPLLAQAERTYVLEKQFNGSSEMTTAAPR